MHQKLPSNNVILQLWCLPAIGQPVPGHKAWTSGDPWGHPVSPCTGTCSVGTNLGRKADIY